MNLKTFSSLKIRNYRLYFIGQGISLMGTWMQSIAQFWLVLQLTGSGTAVGIVAAFQYFPMFFLTPYGGVIVDRFHRRTILYFTQSIMAVLALILGVAVFFHFASLWLIYILALFLGLASAVDNPARQKFILEITDKENLSNAVSLNATIQSLGRAVGPAIAGFLIVFFGIALCFIVNALSFLAVLVALFLMEAKKINYAPLAIPKKGQLAEGLKYVFSTPLLTTTVLMILVVGTLSYEFPVTIPLLAKFTFHGDAKTYSILYTIWGLGSTIGGLAATQIKKINLGVLIWSSMAIAISMILIAVTRNFYFVAVLLAISGLSTIIFVAFSNVLLQLEAAPEMRGRVLSLWAAGSFGSTAIGGPIIGWICQYAGVPWGFAVGGFAAIVAVLMGFSMMNKNNNKLNLQN